MGMTEFHWNFIYKNRWRAGFGLEALICWPLILVEIFMREGKRDITKIVLPEMSYNDYLVCQLRVSSIVAHELWGGTSKMLFPAFTVFFKEMISFKYQRKVSSSITHYYWLAWIEDQQEVFRIYFSNLVFTLLFLLANLKAALQKLTFQTQRKITQRG